LNLAFLLFRYFPHGGLQRDCRRIAEALAGRGHRITIVCQRWEGDQPSGIDVRPLGRSGLANHVADRRFAEAAVSLARSSGADAIVGFNRMAGLDICYSAENSFRARARETRSWLYRLTPRYRAYCRLEDAVFEDPRTAVLLLSAGQLDSYRRHHAIDPVRIHMLPPSIASDRRRVFIPTESRARVRAEFGIPDTAWVVLGIGSNFRTKGVDRSLAAIAALPLALRAKLRFLLVGPENDEAARREASRLGLADAVRVLGARDDVPALLAAADLLLHPARDECTGTAILEAIVAGCPVLCTANCGFSDHVRQAEAGEVLPEPFDPAAMTQTLLGMLESARLGIWSRNGVAYGETTDLYGGIEVAAELIEKILRERARG